MHAPRLPFLSRPARPHRSAARRRATGLAAAAVATAMVASACGTADGSDAADGEEPALRLVAAFYPLEFVAERIAGDRASIETLTEAGAEPHDLELTVRQTAAVSDADLVLYIEGFQPAIDQAVAQGAEDRAVDAPVERRAFGEGGHSHDHDDEDDHAHDDEDDHAHGDDDHAHEDEDHAHDEDGDHGHSHEAGAEDPHLWMDPLNMAAIAEEYAVRFAEVDPEGAEDYRTNAAEIVAELEELDQAYVDGLASCERDEVVVSHDAFGYLARYGLDFEPIAGISPDAEPSPARLAALADLIDETGTTTVFTETLASPRLSETLADELGLETDVLDPIEGLTDETADEDYLSLMEANLAALQRANGCA